jgi:hypothetical protein
MGVRYVDRRIVLAKLRTRGSTACLDAGYPVSLVYIVLYLYCSVSKCLDDPMLGIQAPTYPDIHCPT